MLFKIQMGY